jgi:hypothetical protein
MHYKVVYVAMQLLDINRKVKINVGLAMRLWVLRVSELGTIRVRKKSKDYTLMLTQTTKTIHVIYSIHIILFL